MNESQYHLPPRLLFYSFALVAGGYVVSMVVLFSVGMGLIVAFFPETSSAIGADPVEFEQLMEHRAGDLFPVGLMLPLAMVNALGCFGIGYVLSRLAPFAKFGHSLFLAVILFVSFLQSAIGAPAALQGSLLVLMTLSSAGVVLGSRTFLSHASAATGK